MKIIFVSIPWFHPAYKAGGPVQSIANMVNSFCPRDTEYRIFCSNADLNNVVLNDITTDVWVQYNKNTKVWYSSPGNETKNIIKQVAILQPHILYVIGVFFWHFNLVPLIFCKVPRKIISTRGMLHPGALAQKSFKKKYYFLLWKVLGLHRRFKFHATDENEKKFIQAVFGKQVTVLTAGNFPRQFSPYPVTEKKEEELYLVSIAVLSPMKNILKVLQALAICIGRIKYDIYGPIKEELYWKQCLQVMADLPSNIQVKYHGDIDPLKVEEALQQSQVFILPSESENFGHAIYEALSAGKPVITSYNTPWGGLDEVKSGKNIAIDIPSIADAINFFTALKSAEYQQWSANAAIYASNAIDLKQLNQQYLFMFN